MKPKSEKLARYLVQGREMQIFAHKFSCQSLDFGNNLILVDLIRSLSVPTTQKFDRQKVLRVLRLADKGCALH